MENHREGTDSLARGPVGMGENEAKIPAAETAAGVIPRAVSAVRWTVFGTALQRLATFAAVAVLARLLTETEYGAYRQLLALHLVLFVLLPLGFDQLYIREVKRREHFQRLLAGALGTMSVLIAVILLGGHNLISWLMDFGNWSGMLWLAPGVVLLQGWKTFYKTGLAAQLDYRRISLGEALYAVVAGLGAVSLALIWPVALSLYGAYIIAEVVELIWLSRGKTIALPKSKTALLSFRQDAWNWRRFSLYHCGTQVLNAVGGNAPVLIFGGAVSKAAAASFSMAHYLVTVPVFLLVGALHRVAYSALAGRTREELTGPVLRIMGLAAAFVVPVLIFVTMLAEPLVQLALGASWVDSTAPVVRWVAVYCIWVALFSPISSIDLLLDRPDYSFWWNILATIVRIFAVVGGLKFGVMPAVAAYALSSSVLWVIWGLMLGRLLGCGQKRFHGTWARFVFPWVLFACTLGIVLWLMDDVRVGGNIRWDWLREIIKPLLIIGISLVPGLMYIALVNWLVPTVMRDGLRVLRR